MQTTPRSNRLQIALFGRRNAGKSSLINAVTNQRLPWFRMCPNNYDPVLKPWRFLLGTGGAD